MIDMNFDLDYIRKCSSMIKEFPGIYRGREEAGSRGTYLYQVV